MITVMARIRVDDWNHFKSVHDQAERRQLRVRRGNLTHQVLNQLDDVTDIVFLDTWSSPQDADSYYHSDDFQRDLEEMGASLAELIKLEETDAASIDDGAAPA